LVVTNQGHSFKERKEKERERTIRLAIVAGACCMLMGTPAARFLGDAKDRWGTTPS